jgi:hypothetical protein
MTTRDQEREALAKIRRIVEALGENSYIGTAFVGVWELAEQNIDCDSASSTRYYIDATHKAQAFEREQRARDEENERRNAFLLEQVQKCSLRIQELEQELEGTFEMIKGDEHALADQTHVIVTLKAKLYDLQNPDA